MIKMSLVVLAVLTVGVVVSSEDTIASIFTSNHDHKVDDVSHSGRTNSSGCHNDNINGGYHCH